MFFLVFYIFLNMEVVTTTPAQEYSRLENLIGVPALHMKWALINLLLILLLVLLFTGLTNSLVWGPAMAELLCTAFSILNLYVADFRGNALSAADLAAWGTALDVAPGYQLRLGFRPFLGITLLVIFMVIVTKMPDGRLFSSPQGHVAAAVIGLLLFTAGTKVMILSPFLSDYGVDISYFNTMRSYRKYGTAATLARSVREAKPERPKGYSPETAKTIAAEYSTDTMPEPGLEQAKEEPNVIVVMLEAFADIRKLGDFETSEDPMPYFHSLEEKYPSGTVYASTLGGMTANSEFEFLTGHSMAFLPSASVPFQLYIRAELPSMASRMKELGYTGISALHPFNPANYRRDKVYPLLGFETFYSRDNLPEKLDMIRKFPSDASDFKNLTRIYETEAQTQSGPWYLYNLTVQNHSSYDLDYDNFSVKIQATGLSKTYKELGQYLTLVKYTDDAIRSLIEYYEGIEEPTVILLIGDHQPKLPGKFYKEIMGEDYQSNAQAAMALYQVPYLIWTNAMQEGQASRQEPKQDITSMNYLQAVLMKETGLRMTGYQKYLLELSEKIPVINTVGYWGSDGVFYENKDTGSPYYQDLMEYAILEYNCLYDSAHRLENFF